MYGNFAKAQDPLHQHGKDEISNNIHRVICSVELFNKSVIIPPYPNPSARGNLDKIWIDAEHEPHTMKSITTTNLQIIQPMCEKDAKSRLALFTDFILLTTIKLTRQYH